MLFNSLAYLVFLPAAFLLYWFSPQKIRPGILLLISYYFYLSAGTAFVLLLIATTLLTWGMGLFIEKRRGERSAKWSLAFTLIIIFSLLGFFKYYNFLLGSFTDFLRLFAIQIEPHLLNLIMPVGISFYSFQSAGYLIDVYRGKSSAEKSPLKLALFVSFFPQIIAGPIGRSDHLLPQFNEKRTFDAEKASEGLRLMLWGFFKKLIIADSLAKYVDRVFDLVPYFFGMTFIMAAVMYTFEIYCDFSGYSDIAIGTAKLFNIDLMTNFKSSYFSRSLQEFWSRWHISLSSWFRDYLYIPLGGNRKGKFRKNLNLLITMLVSGLWHGANWTFVVWGGLHGIYQVAEGFLKEKFGKPKETVLSNIVHGVITFGLVCIAWVFFRANSIGDAIYIVTHFHNGVVFHFLDAWEKMTVDMQITAVGLVKLLASIVFLMVYDFISLKKDIPKEMGKWKIVPRWIVYLALVILIIVSKLHGGTTQQFIYFNF